MPTALEYFQRVFDRYPVAWDEGPFLYRQLNFARNQVARDCDIITIFQHTADTDIVYLPRAFLAVRKVYLKTNDSSIMYALRYKAVPYSPVTEWQSWPVNYYLVYPNEVHILPSNFEKRIDWYFEIHYVPKCQDMSKLSDEEQDLPEQVFELVVLQVCMRLAENDLQYAAKQYFENEYKLLLLKIPRASYLHG